MGIVEAGVLPRLPLRTFRLYIPTIASSSTLFGFLLRVPPDSRRRRCTPRGAPVSLALSRAALHRLPPPRTRITASEAVPLLPRPSPRSSRLPTPPMYSPSRTRLPRSFPRRPSSPTPSPHTHRGFRSRPTLAPAFSAVLPTADAADVLPEPQASPSLSPVPPLIALPLPTRIAVSEAAPPSPLPSPRSSRLPSPPPMYSPPSTRLHHSLLRRPSSPTPSPHPHRGLSSRPPHPCLLRGPPDSRSLPPMYSPPRTRLPHSLPRCPSSPTPSPHSHRGLRSRPTLAPAFSAVLPTPEAADVLPEPCPVGSARTTMTTSDERDLPWRGADGRHHSFARARRPQLPPMPLVSVYVRRLRSTCRPPPPNCHRRRLPTYDAQFDALLASRRRHLYKLEGGGKIYVTTCVSDADVDEYRNGTLAGDDLLAKLQFKYRKCENGQTHIWLWSYDTPQRYLAERLIHLRLFGREAHAVPQICRDAEVLGLLGQKSVKRTFFKSPAGLNDIWDLLKI
ncbi:hypothetical protein B0H13DRAFT_2341232 [Mycena leptocephala]|nr:hypothetical protein B0H13DRAFT_2341232 [Mycena leptocephala]